NKDKRITMMRIEDPTGDYKILEEDNRIMVKADLSKGEVGTHKLFTEGRDNDQDGYFNEDGEGGVAFNRNLSYNFPYFTPGAGEFPVSQKETRALLDFLYERPNIYSIWTFGPANNLTKPLKYNPSGANKRVVTSILKGDAKLNELISKTYNKIVSPKNAPASVAEGGGFFEWSYFHFGKLAMSTPGWWAPMPEADSTQKATKNVELNFLRWAAQNEVDDVFVDWTEVKHPDFPNQKVEVGGMVPFKQMNPPYAMVAAAVEKHSKFLLEFLGMQASVEFENLKTESLGDGISRITVDLHNPGILPTHTEMGDRSRWLRQINVDLKLGSNQSIVSGNGHQLVNLIPQDGKVQLTWLVSGKGTIELTAGAPHVGTQTLSIKL
ncbi:MAG: peptidase, partial [Bacteroidota bacterium]